jgi:hypothetical protein
MMMAIWGIQISKFNFQISNFKSQISNLPRHIRSRFLAAAAMLRAVGRCAAHKLG